MSLVLAAASFAAGGAVAPTSSDVLEVVPNVRYSVPEGEIGRSQTFVAQAEWETTSTVGIPADGVVTTLDAAPGSRLQVGQVLMTVDLEPVWVFEGQVPAFRDLRLDARGRDVEQLGASLSALGYETSAADGHFDVDLQRQLRSWQRNAGRPETGEMLLGDYVFLPSLPAPFAYGSSLAVGTRIAPGPDAVVEVLAAEPSFLIALDDDQRDLVPLQARVEVRHPEGRWEAVIAAAQEDVPTPEEQGAPDQLRLLLSAPAGGSVCGSSCDLVPVGVVSDYSAEVELVPPVRGTVVPLSAMTTTPSGDASVEVVDGSRRDVDVLVSADGLAVVTGLDVGEQILLDPADVRDGSQQ